MLKKLLRYDLKFLFKYWWIVALATLPIAVAGGLSFRTLLRANADITALQIIFSSLGMIGAVVAIVAMAIMPVILNGVRFYKNLYSDEGYLTFTLPVERRDILKAKLLSAMILQLTTILLVVVEVLIFTLCATMGLEDIGVVVLPEFRASYLLLGLEVLILFLEAEMFSILLMYACISFGAIIAKKHKVLAAVGIYYGVGGLVSGIGQFFYMIGAVLVAGIIASGEQIGEIVVVSFMLVPVITILGAVVMGLYTLVHWQMDRKLNLS